MSRFCTVVNFMDGRVQLAVIKYLQRRFDVDYVDTITEPGPNLILAHRNYGMGSPLSLCRLSLRIRSCSL
ncbi:MAG: hypothetical protein DRP87_13470 [Spirochaetes bacterium]|nr:MAG: hypothetical protein DRP87_13470 [Spirochaetota bacterium]